MNGLLVHLPRHGICAAPSWLWCPIMECFNKPPQSWITTGGEVYAALRAAIRDVNKA